MVAQPQPTLTPAGYLDWEAQQPLRYEFVDGQVVAMTGGTIPHNQIAVNLVALLRPHLRGRNCKVLSGDAKVAISDDGPFFYPDVTVTCDERDRTARSYIRFPCLVVEVLSESTEARDRGYKFRRYRQIETLQEYVLIDPDRILVECYRRNERDNWELVTTMGEVSGAAAEDSLVLDSVGLEIALSQVYEDVVFPNETEAL
ncbi:Uma2 family endonuclease [Nodosilinea sp. PGN35]|uniref:Uma2 family endonuclease n=1 Tax=Nodosilinea sp. PGN35 TaxID=3020489 RepID=UPI0023B25DFC|nr:Uma2 family endonuclease [Nodosilinea sp. TSF1-S3]MDF0366798.1 Uma2 family endonuclease [Nodosilinea sp. TSF1-S3]